MYKKKQYVKKETVVRKPFVPSYPPSEEQSSIFNALEGTDNIHIEASPGSGKSTTTVWGMTKVKERNAAVLAFGTAIVADLEPRCPIWVECRTASSFGYRALSASVGRLTVDTKGYKVQKILKGVLPSHDPDMFEGKAKGQAYSLMFNAVKLINMLRLNLVDETDVDKVIRVSLYYNIEVADELIPALPRIFAVMKSQVNYIDFIDMMWLPLVLGLKVPKFKMLYVDERQDFNSLMIAYINLMYDGRIMTVGDTNQSIMGFAGADPKSTERLVAAFPGMELPLNVCYRCGTDIVARAARVYDKIKPYHGNLTGIVEERDILDMTMPDGSMILARRNADLISPCFQFIKEGRKAIIKGRNIGEGLLTLIKQLKASSVFDLIDKVNDHREARIEKLYEKEIIPASAIDMINDTADCIVQMAEACSTIEEIEQKINIIFSEETTGVVLSSIHRSKGLEADMVSIVNYGKVRLCYEKMTPDEHIQEKNLEFVALTRPKKILHLIN